MSGRFQGTRTVITGAAGGLGAAMAEAFAAEGARVMVADIDGAAADELAARLPGARSFAIDVLREDEHVELARVVTEAWGGIDVVCANAGLPHRAANLIDLPTEDFERMFDVNVRSVYFAAKHFVPHMPPGSSIVATSSIGAVRPRPGLTAYNASKGAVLTLVRGLAGELAPDIRVNAVLPVSAPTGFDRTALGRDLPENLEAAVIRGIPMGRRATPGDVANAVLFLADPASGFLTGVCLDVDGGRSIQ